MSNREPLHYVERPIGIFIPIQFYCISAFGFTQEEGSTTRVSFLIKLHLNGTDPDVFAEVGYGQWEAQGQAFASNRRNNIGIIGPMDFIRRLSRFHAAEDLG